MAEGLIVCGRNHAVEGHIVRRPYEKSNGNFSSCGRGGSPWRAQQEGVAMKRLDLPLPGRVLRVGRSQLGLLGGGCNGRKGLLGLGHHRRDVFGVG